MIVQQVLPLLQYGLRQGLGQRTQGQARDDGVHALALWNKLTKVGGIAVHDIQLRIALAQTGDKSGAMLDHQEALRCDAAPKQRLRNGPRAGPQLDDQAIGARIDLAGHLASKKRRAGADGAYGARAAAEFLKENAWYDFS